MAVVFLDRHNDGKLGVLARHGDKERFFDFEKTTCPFERQKLIDKARIIAKEWASSSKTEASGKEPKFVTTKPEPPKSKQLAKTESNNPQLEKPTPVDDIVLFATQNQEGVKIGVRLKEPDSEAFYIDEQIDWRACWQQACNAVADQNGYDFHKRKQLSTSSPTVEDRQSFTNLLIQKGLSVNKDFLAERGFS